MTHAEQRRIVAKVEQGMALVGALETQFAASLATAANLLSALVAELTTACVSGASSGNERTATGTATNRVRRRTRSPNDAGITLPRLG